jgi:hypothetical protein
MTILAQAFSFYNIEDPEAQAQITSLVDSYFSAMQLVSYCQNAPYTTEFELQAFVEYSSALFGRFCASIEVNKYQIANKLYKNLSEEQYVFIKKLSYFDFLSPKVRQMLRTMLTSLVISSSWQDQLKLADIEAPTRDLSSWQLKLFQLTEVHTLLEFALLDAKSPSLISAIRTTINYCTLIIATEIYAQTKGLDSKKKLDAAVIRLAKIFNKFKVVTQDEPHDVKTKLHNASLRLVDMLCPNDDVPNNLLLNLTRRYIACVEYNDWLLSILQKSNNPINVFLIIVSVLQIAAKVDLDQPISYVSKILENMGGLNEQNKAEMISKITSCEVIVLEGLNWQVYLRAEDANNDENSFIYTCAQDTRPKFTM